MTDLSSTAQAAALDLPAGFNIREYIAAKRAAHPANATALVTDPVLHLYSVVQYQTQADDVGRIRLRAQAAAKAAGRSLVPLVYGNSWGFWGQSPASTLVAQVRYGGF